MNRQQFLLSISAAWLYARGQAAVPGGKGYLSRRPPVGQRRFSSPAIDELIAEVKSHIADPQLQWLFENCLPNTLDTTVFFNRQGNTPLTYVITGDIDAMWLRDSSAQVWPYLPYLQRDSHLQQMIAGVIYQQTAFILKDPYANAFYNTERLSEWRTDKTDMKPGVHERKWEVDSLCYTLRLAHGYWQYSGDTAPFTAEWLKAVGIILQTFREQQRWEGPGPYRFERPGARNSDTLCCKGEGRAIKPNGLICSAFRPSDDSTQYLFLIPSNLFAMTVLGQLRTMLQKLYPANTLITQCDDLMKNIDSGLKACAAYAHPKYGTILPYETDGMGQYNLMDDANVPSLLSLPYLTSLPADDFVYTNTRKFILNSDNPYFFKGSAAEGIGGPHVGKDMIWPMSITMRALTSSNEAEIVNCLKMLIGTHAGTGFMHESFHKNRPAHYTRKWFAWANTLFGELILQLHTKHPDLLQRRF